MTTKDVLALQAKEPVAWEATTPGYISYVTDKQYRSYSETAKRWYKPYKCSSCTAPKQAKPVQHDSDCSLHNGPAYPAGPCDCSQSKAPKQADPAWQPIESAPKDGRDIIVYFKTVGIRQVSWCDEYGDPSGEYALWRVDDNKHGPYALRGYRPGDDTHWMHLPTPPEAT